MPARDIVQAQRTELWKVKKQLQANKKMDVKGKPNGKTLTSSDRERLEQKQAQLEHALEEYREQKADQRADDIKRFTERTGDVLFSRFEHRLSEFESKMLQRRKQPRIAASAHMRYRRAQRLGVRNSPTA